MDRPNSKLLKIKHFTGRILKRDLIVMASAAALASPASAQNAAAAPSAPEESSEITARF